MDFMLIMEFKGSLTNCLTTGFRVHPNYGNEVRQQYNNVFADITKSNMLGFITSQIAKRIITPKLGPDFSQQVYDAEYALS